MSEQNEITRRDFIKGVAATILGLKYGRSLVANAENSAQTGKNWPIAPGSYKEPEKAEVSGVKTTTEISRLPEKEKNDREWKKIITKVFPPPSQRSALTYCQKRDSFILHGGYGYDANHNETWEFKNKQWSLIEKGSTPSLHGHKIVETPEGLVMFGGVKLLSGGSYETSNKFYLFSETKNCWQELSPSMETSEGGVDGLQGMGMVYNNETRSVWILAGGFGNPVQLSDGIHELFLPGVWNKNDPNWFYRGMGTETTKNYHPVFEPLAFTYPGDNSAYLYGGIGGDRGGGVGIYSNELWRIYPSNTNVIVNQEAIPFVDYGGSVKGGYDLKSKQLILHAGRPLFYFAYPYSESVEYDKETNSWYKVASPENPPVRGEPAVAMNFSTGELLCFGGSYYDQNGQAQWSTETWICRPIYKIHLPFVQK